MENPASSKNSSKINLKNLFFASITFIAILLLYKQFHFEDKRKTEVLQKNPENPLSDENFLTNRKKIIAKITELQIQNKYLEAKQEAARYLNHNDQEISALYEFLISQIRIQELEQSLATVPDDATQFITSNYEELVRLAPSNKYYSERYDFYSRRLKIELIKAEKEHERSLVQEQKNSAAAEKAERAATKNRGVHIGMTAQEAIQSSWGKPLKINRTITAGGTHEQWVYGSGNYLYFDNGVLTAINN